MGTLGGFAIRVPHTNSLTLTPTGPTTREPDPRKGPFNFNAAFATVAAILTGAISITGTNACPTGEAVSLESATLKDRGGWSHAFSHPILAKAHLA